MLSNHYRIFGRLYLALDQNGQLERDENAFLYFRVESELLTNGFRDDLGPMNLGAIFRFCQDLKGQIEETGGKLAALTAEEESESWTNVIFLLGAYMILHLGEEATVVIEQLRSLFPSISSYKDAMSPGKSFELRVEDCWMALHKAKMQEWIDFAGDTFDVDEYEHYDDPRNADLHVVVPNKLLAMKGPVALPDGKLWLDKSQGTRVFSPQYLAETLLEFDVKLVVRLNEPTYHSDTFAAHNIAVADLFIQDCALPSDSDVVKFLLIVENVPGVVAVHCRSGLGRTGTFIALYLIKNFDFTAREAIAWMRIVRPGSVVGHQQRYLCSIERTIARLRHHPLSGPYAKGIPTSFPTPPPPAAVSASTPSPASGAAHGESAAPRPDLTNADLPIPTVDSLREMVANVIRRVDASPRRRESSPPPALPPHGRAPAAARCLAATVAFTPPRRPVDFAAGGVKSAAGATRPPPLVAGGADPLYPGREALDLHDLCSRSGPAAAAAAARKPCRRHSECSLCGTLLAAAATAAGEEKAHGGGGGERKGAGRRLRERRMSEMMTPVAAGVGEMEEGGGHGGEGGSCCVS